MIFDELLGFGLLFMAAASSLAAITDIVLKGVLANSTDPLLLGFRPLWVRSGSGHAQTHGATQQKVRQATIDLSAALLPAGRLGAQAVAGGASPRRPVRGRKPHDPRFNVRKALYQLVGLDLTQMEGLDELHALTLISELGTDFSKLPTVKHFTSWLGLCPNFKKTGGKVQSSKTRQGKNRAAHALRLGAFSLIRSKSFLGAYMRRQRTRLGAPKAITAAAHKLARILYAMMRYGLAYVKRSEAEFTEEQREKQELNLHKKARALGYKVVKIEEPSESVEPASTAV